VACEFFETATLTGTRLYVVAVIEHAHRRIRSLGATAHSTAAWVTQAARNLVMDLDDAGQRPPFTIRLGRDPQRVPRCRLTCTDEVSGKRRAEHRTWPCHSMAPLRVSV
jgi:hypothetical protein